MKEIYSKSNLISIFLYFINFRKMGLKDKLFIFLLAKYDKCPLSKEEKH